MIDYFTVFKDDYTNKEIKNNIRRSNYNYLFKIPLFKDTFIELTKKYNLDNYSDILWNTLYPMVLIDKSKRVYNQYLKVVSLEFYYKNKLKKLLSYNPLYSSLSFESVLNEKQNELTKFEKRKIKVSLINTSGIIIRNFDDLLYTLNQARINIINKSDLKDFYKEYVIISNISVHNLKLYAIELDFYYKNRFLLQKNLYELYSYKKESQNLNKEDFSQDFLNISIEELIEN